MVRCTHDTSPYRVSRIACVTVAFCLVACIRPGSGSKVPGTEALQSLLSFTDLAATTAGNDSIAFLNTLAAAVQHTAQSGLQILADVPSRFAEAFGRSQDLVSTQFASTPLSAVIQHPFPAYPETLFTWAVCSTYNPYLIISVRDQEVPLISVGQPVNESVLSFAISSWSEIAYHDPSLTQYQFKIAEDLIYDIRNDTFAVATPFDVKNGRGQIPGVSSVGHSTHNSSMGSSADDDDYHIKFTFAASPLAKHANTTGAAGAGAGKDPSAARNVSAPGAGVQRLLTGQIKDNDIKGRATDAFTELVARLYFNLATAALGNLCNPGYPALAPVASYMINRLKTLNANVTSYYNLPLNEALIDDGDGRLCLQESNTLYNVGNMLAISTTIAFSAPDCCHACRLTEQNNATVACNAWVFCGAAGGCHNATTSYAAAKNECSLYYASDLDYNVPLDKNVGVVRAPDVTFVSGRTQAVIADNIMSILVPPRESGAAPIDKTASFQQVKHPQDNVGGNN